jgi:hypothetical protein
MDISVLKSGSGPWFSKVAPIEFCRILVKKRKIQEGVIINEQTKRDGNEIRREKRENGIETLKKEKI